MTCDIVDACPDCGSTDVIGMERPMRQRGHQTPPYRCEECGVGFWNAKQYDTVTEEFV